MSAARLRPFVLTLCALLALLLVSPSEARAAETPEQALTEESTRLRGILLDEHPGFTERMSLYQEHAAMLDKVNSALDEWAPVLGMIDQLKQAGDMGLFLAMTAVDSRLAIIPQAIDTIQKARQVAEQLSALGQQMTLLTDQVSALLANPTLTLEQARSMRIAAIPQGRIAIESFVRLYAEVQPSLAMLDQQLKNVEAQIGKMLSQATGSAQTGAIITSLLGSNLSPALGDIFKVFHDFRNNLDSLADNAPRDLAALDALEIGLRDVEVHHLYAQADVLADAGDTTQAKQALDFLIQNHSDSPWSKRAEQRIKSLDHATKITSDDPDAEAASGAPSLASIQSSNTALWIVIVVLLLALGGVGGVAWKQRARSEGSNA